MIKRTIYAQLKNSVSNRPVTIVTGARQVGKTTLCLKLAEELKFNYVTLKDFHQRSIAINDPEMFLHMHECPLIIDEFQYAPGLFEYIESAVDKKKRTGDAKGMYVLICCRMYELMKNVPDSLAGGASIIHVSPLSYNEIICREEYPFRFRVGSTVMEHFGRSIDLNIKKFYKRIIRGMYPEPEVNRNISTSAFYSDYVATCIERNVSNIINVVDKQRFRSFMQVLASFTGQELVYSDIASAVGVNQKTVKSWVNVLMACDIIHLLKPYNDELITKRVTKRPKIYFWDTGLACYLAKILDVNSLRAGYLNGPMVKTYIVNEFIKSYRNNGEESPFYYYRDNDGREVDLVMVDGGGMTLIKCMAGSNFGEEDVKSLVSRISPRYSIMNSYIICPGAAPKLVFDDIFNLLTVIPPTAI